MKSPMRCLLFTALAIAAGPLAAAGSASNRAIGSSSDAAAPPDAQVDGSGMERLHAQATPPPAGQGQRASGPDAGPPPGQAATAAGLPPPPGARAGIGDRAIDAEEARVTAGELAHELERYYVFPETGQRYAAAIRAKAESGGYDAIGSSAALAERLSADLGAVATDNHLRVEVGAPDAPRPSDLAANPPPPRPAGRGRLIALPMENSLEAPRWLAPSVAYLRINSFAGDETQLARVQEFITDHLTARAIIFDLRTNGGGGFAEIDVMFPYFFAQPTTLAMLETRDAADPITFTRLLEGPTLKRVADVPGYVRREHRIEPHPSETRLRDAKLYVLTSSETRSAGEHFAMALKHTGRATLIGQTTAGAGHTTMMRMLGGGFAVAVPVGRTVDPQTGAGWEGSGIEPDIKVHASAALIEALVLSGVSRAEAERIYSELAGSAASSR
jgi:hypothetical protein